MRTASITVHDVIASLCKAGENNELIIYHVNNMHLRMIAARKFHIAKLLSLSEISKLHSVHKLPSEALQARMQLHWGLRPTPAQTPLFPADGCWIGSWYVKRVKLTATSIGVDLAGILGGTHDDGRRWFGAEWRIFILFYQTW